MGAAEISSHSRRAQPGELVSMAATLILRHLDAFRLEVGVDTVDRAIASLPLPVQRELEALVPGAWLGCDRIDMVYEAIARESGRPLDDLLPMVAERGNEDAFSTVWKALLRMVPGRLIVRRAATVFAKSYTHGMMEARSTDAGLQLELTHWPNVPRNRLLGIASGARAILRVAGQPDVHVAWERTPDGALFNVRF